MEPLRPNTIHIWSALHPNTDSFAMRKHLLSYYTNSLEKNIEFEKTPNGKPYLKNSTIEYNISHSKHHVVMAISESPIGIDTEFRKRINFLGIAKRFFHPDETEYISSLKTFQKEQDYFYKTWTMKEAYCKAKGEKLARHLSTNIHKCSEWIFETVRLRHRYFTTLCYEGTTKKNIKIFDYNSFLK